MKFIAALCIFSIALLVVPALPSLLTTTGCGSHCTTCWTISGKCAECEANYFFAILGKENTKCYSGLDYDNGRQIPGYMRACAECGPHNYLDAKFNCKACPEGCDVCNTGSDGKCTKCYSSENTLNNYNAIEADGLCVCNKGNAKEINNLCQCNDNDHWLDDAYVCNECDKCNRDKANCLTSPLAVIPKYFWDDDNAGCPKECHESCDACHGAANTDCDKIDDDLLCRNSDLWEEVKGDATKGECYCVCHATETKVNGKSVCTCEENRVATDSCAGKTCDAFETLNKMQCLCKPGYVEGEADSSGKVPCVIVSIAS